MLSFTLTFERFLLCNAHKSTVALFEAFLTIALLAHEPGLSADATCDTVALAITLPFGFDAGAFVSARLDFRLLETVLELVRDRARVCELLGIDRPDLFDRVGTEGALADAAAGRHRDLLWQHGLWIPGCTRDFVAHALGRTPFPVMRTIIQACHRTHFYRGCVRVVRGVSFGAVDPDALARALDGSTCVPACRDALAATLPADAVISRADALCAQSGSGELAFVDGAVVELAGRVIRVRMLTDGQGVAHLQLSTRSGGWARVDSGNTAAVCTAWFRRQRT